MTLHLQAKLRVAFFFVFFCNWSVQAQRAVFGPSVDGERGVKHLLNCHIHDGTAAAAREGMQEQKETWKIKRLITHNMPFIAWSG